MFPLIAAYLQSIESNQSIFRRKSMQSTFKSDYMSTRALFASTKYLFSLGISVCATKAKDFGVLSINLITVGFV